MSIDQKELKIRLKTRRNRALVGVLLAVEFVLSLVLCVSLAAQIVWPEVSGATNTIGAPLLINYEGYLTDSGNNPLGGSAGTEYCFHFSIYNAPTNGTELWPAATPSVTAATATNGVFEAVLGSADKFASTTFDFSTSSTAYLDVAVNTTSGSTCTSGGSYQELSPRQQILSSGYALTSSNVTGQALTTVEAPTGSTTVQVGLGGGGSAAPTYFGLDIKNVATAGQDNPGNTCTVNGLLWYDSANSHILACLQGTVVSLDDTSASLITNIVAGNGGTASSGTLSFANSNGISFGINACTITASDIGNVTLSYYEPFPFISPVTTIANGNSSFYVEPFQVQRVVSMAYVQFPVNMSVSSLGFIVNSTTSYSLLSSQANTISLIIYQTSSNGTVFTSYASTTVTFAQQISMSGSATSNNISYNFSFPPYGGGANISTQLTASTATNTMSLGEVPGGTSLFTGYRYLDIPFATSLAPGNYWLGIQRLATTVGAVGYGITSLALSASSVGSIAPMNSTTNSSYGVVFGLGSALGTTASLLSSFGLNNLSSVAGNPRLYFQFIKSS